MRKASFLLVIVLLFTVISPLSAIANEEPIKVTVNGKLINFDVQPTIINGRTLVPVRAIFETLGLKVIWDGQTRTVIGQKDNLEIKLPIGNKKAKKNDIEIELDAPAMIINNRTLVPVRFIAESLGAKVSWDGETRTVIIEMEDKINSLGLLPTTYPDISTLGVLGYLTRLEEGMAEARGYGQDILAVNANEKQKELYSYIVPDSNVKFVSNIQINNDIVKGYEIVVIYDYDDFSNIIDIVKKNPNIIFVIAGDLYETSDYINDINELSKFDNVVTVGRVKFPHMSLDEGFDKNGNEKKFNENINKIDIDIFAPANDIKFIYQIEKDNAVTLVAAAISLLLNENKEIKDMDDYIKNNSKHYYTVKKNFINLLDLELLLKKDYKISKRKRVLNLNNKIKGKGVKVAILDSSFDLEAKGLKNKYVEAKVFSTNNQFNFDLFKGYDAKGKYTHGTDMARRLLSIAPDCELYLLMAEVVWSPNGYTNEAENKIKALDYVLKNDIDVISMSWGDKYATNKELIEKIKEVADAGVIIDWFWYPEKNDNVITMNPIYANGYERLNIKKFDTYVYDRFFEGYNNTDIYKWGISPTAPSVAGLVTLMKEVKPDIQGKEIKELFNNFSIFVDKEKQKGIPNMNRILSILEKGLKFKHNIQIINSNMNLLFNKDYNIEINGKPYNNANQITIPVQYKFTITVSDNNKKIIEPSTQLVDLKILKNSKGELVLESTFNGTIKTQYGIMKVKKGFNNIDKDIETVEVLSIEYDLD